MITLRRQTLMICMLTPISSLSLLRDVVEQTLPHTNTNTGDESDASDGVGVRCAADRQASSRLYAAPRSRGKSVDALQ